MLVVMNRQRQPRLAPRTLRGDVEWPRPPQWSLRSGGAHRGSRRERRWADLGGARWRGRCGGGISRGGVAAGATAATTMPNSQVSWWRWPTHD